MEKKTRFKETGALSVKQLKKQVIVSFAVLSVIALTIGAVVFSWIEGSSSIEVSDTTSLNIYSAQKAFTITPAETASYINLAPYIDNSSNLFLAPATSTDGHTIQIKNGGTYRNAVTNDIGTNYIDFDFQVSTTTETRFYFTSDSSITVEGSTSNPIKTSVTVSNTDYTNASSATFTAAGLANSNVTVLDSGVTKIFRIRIWCDAEDSSYAAGLAGKTVNMNLKLASKTNLTSLTFVDRTMNKTSQYLAKNYTMKAYDTARSREYPLTYSAGTDSYTSSAVSLTALSNLEFRCYNGTTLLAKWAPPNAADHADGTYTAYGDVFSSTSNGTGTWGSVEEVTFKDLSLGKSFSANQITTITNGIDTYFYRMYYSAGEYTAFVPAESFTSANTGGNIYFNGRDTSNNSLTYVTVPIADVNTDREYAVFGDSGTLGTDYSDKLYVGKWTTGTADTVYLRDRSTARSVEAESGSVKVSFDGTNYYKTSYDSLTRLWSVNLPADDTDLAVSSTSYNFTANNRTQTDGSYIYTFTSTTEGTWSYTDPLRLTFTNSSESTASTINMYAYDTVNAIAYKMTQDTTTSWHVNLPDNVTNVTYYRCSKDYALDINNLITGTATAAGYYNSWAAGNRYLNTAYTATSFSAGSWTDTWQLSRGNFTQALAKSSDGVYTYEYTASGAESKTFNIVNSTAIDTYGLSTTISSSTASALTFTKGVTSLTTLTCAAAGKYTFTVNTTGTSPTLTVAYVGSKTIYFYNSSSWSAPYAYIWTSGGSSQTGWPGTAMTNVSGNKWSIDVPNQYNRIIFSNNGSSKTGDLTIPTDSNTMYNLATGTWVSPDSTTQPSSYYLRGTLSDWDTGTNMVYPIAGSNIVTTTVTLSAGSYQFKIYNGTWYGNTGTITDTCSNWTFSSTAGNCTISATGGTYTFSYNTSTNQLTVTKS